MPSSFTVEIKGDWTVPDFMDADVPLKQIAEKVVTDSQRNIRQQTMPDGRNFEPLSKKTIKDKIREGVPYPRRALYRKGIMYNALHVYKIGKNQYEVGVIPRGKPPRDYVAGIHSGIGATSHILPIRMFLGISVETLNWANARMERWISENIRKAAKKYINLKY